MYRGEVGEYSGDCGLTVGYAGELGEYLGELGE